MADNITLNPGSGGSVVASDDISGVQHQLVKVEFGADGSVTPVSEANPLPARNPAATSVYSTTVTATGTHTVDLNANLGRNATTVLLQRLSSTAPQSTLEIDLDGTGTYTDPLTLSNGGSYDPFPGDGAIFKLEGISIDTLRIIETGTSEEILVIAY